MCNRLLFRSILKMCVQNLKFVALRVPEIIAIAVLGWVANPQSWEGEAVGGRGWHRSKALVISYRLSIVTFPLSLRVSDLPLLCSSTPLFPTPPLISPKFPHVGPWEYSGWLLGYKERRCCAIGLIVRAISFQDFQHMWSWSIKVTDRQTSTCNLHTALCTRTSRGKNSITTFLQQASKKVTVKQMSCQVQCMHPEAVSPRPKHMKMKIFIRIKELHQEAEQKKVPMR